MTMAENPAYFAALADASRAKGSPLNADETAEIYTKFHQPIPASLLADFLGQAGVPRVAAAKLAGIINDLQKRIAALEGNPAHFAVEKRG
jgi:hypothetical protein